uniref:Protein kinase domain-containing protein n=1 Tax=Meloidogyne incognita TaxID=6306 RepID=A0A914MPD8_MELIC
MLKMPICCKCVDRLRPPIILLYYQQCACCSSTNLQPTVPFVLLRNQCADRRQLCCNAIRELHEVCGFISRDIKAGNFVTGQTTSDDIRNIYLIDFGLCRKYKDANNNIVAARPDVGWRGTTRYGSRSAHLHQDLARRDDVESWFYMIVEMTKGSLPWSAERDRAAVYKSKLAALSNLDDFLNGCPQGYRELIGPIIKLNFGDAPAYKEMGRVLERIITEQGIDKKGKMDWELAEEPEVEAQGEQLDSFPTSTTQRRV